MSTLVKKKSESNGDHRFGNLEQYCQSLHVQGGGGGGLGVETTDDPGNLSPIAISFAQDIIYCLLNAWLTKLLGSNELPTWHKIGRVMGRVVKFDIQIGSDWPQMGPIWEFLRSV